MLSLWLAVSVLVAFVFDVAIIGLMESLINGYSIVLTRNKSFLFFYVQLVLRFLFFLVLCRTKYENKNKKRLLWMSLNVVSSHIVFMFDEVVVKLMELSIKRIIEQLIRHRCRRESSFISMVTFYAFLI